MNAADSSIPDTLSEQLRPSVPRWQGLPCLGDRAQSQSIPQFHKRCASCLVTWCLIEHAEHTRSFCIPSIFSYLQLCQLDTCFGTPGHTIFLFFGLPTHQCHERHSSSRSAKRDGASSLIRNRSTLNGNFIAQECRCIPAVLPRESIFQSRQLLASLVNRQRPFVQI